MIPKAIAIAGLVLSLVGFLILFRFGMPYRVATEGAIHLVLGRIDEGEIRLDKRYRRWGQVGLAVSVIGTIVQAAAVLLA